ncbi:MAG: hypothetical protein VKL59_09585 [Nostocaceae cyanobacterium]|nr:hypothetical protein [Nostocaceae cyanobacterium]
MKYKLILVAVIIFACQGCSFVADLQTDQYSLPSQTLEQSPTKVRNQVTGQQLKTPDKSGRLSMSDNIISAEIQPLPNQAQPAAKALQSLGFRILHIGQTISVEAPRSLWESTFNVSFTSEQKNVLPEIPTGRVRYPKAVTDKMQIPSQLIDSVAEVMFQEPPEFF